MRNIGITGVVSTIALIDINGADYSLVLKALMERFDANEYEATKALNWAIKHKVVVCDKDILTINM